MESGNGNENGIKYQLEFSQCLTKPRSKQLGTLKTIGLISKTTTLHVHHTFLYISFPFLHDSDVKMPNFSF